MIYRTVRKCKGSSLIEVIAGLMILMLATTMAMTSIIATNKSSEKRREYEELNRIIYCIMNEIKYNYSYENIKYEFSNQKLEDENNKYIGFKYKEEILNELLTKPLFSLVRGSDIKIKIISEESNKKILTMKIEINLPRGAEEINVEREFNKSWWME